MLTDEYLSSLVKRKVDGESYTSIKEDLRGKNLDEEKIKVILKYVDSQVLRAETGKTVRAGNREAKYIGFFLLAFGLIMTIGTYLGFLNNGRVMVLAYGPVLTGLGLLIFGYRVEKKKRITFRRS